MQIKWHVITIILKTEVLYKQVIQPNYISRHAVVGGAFWGKNKVFFFYILEIIYYHQMAQNRDWDHWELLQPESMIKILFVDAKVSLNNIKE